MFVQGFGEVLTDVMTVNPALADLPSASSILDTSNFTFQAITFGKDSGGFIQHSHAVSSIQYVNGISASGASSYDNGLLNIINYASDAPSGASSYIPSGTYLKFSSTYDSVPNYPSVTDTRLERGSTLNSNLSDYQYASALPDLGHYANPGIDPQLSAIWNKVGGFGPAVVGTGYDYVYHNKDLSNIFVGNVSASFNAFGSQVMDKDGYLTIGPSSVSQHAGSPNYTPGSVLLSSIVNPVSGGKLIIGNRFQYGDIVSMAAFGGVKHVGVYCLDLKEMLGSSLMPPYGWDALNNIRKYKLVAKTTVLDDMFYNRDYLTFPGLVTVGVVNSIIISLDLDFK